MAETVLLLQDGYAETFKEMMETTKWEEYGVASGNPKCANCIGELRLRAHGGHRRFLQPEGIVGHGQGQLQHV